MHTTKRFKLTTVINGRRCGSLIVDATDIVDTYRFCTKARLNALPPGMELSCNKGLHTTFIISVETN